MKSVWPQRSVFGGKERERLADFLAAFDDKSIHLGCVKSELIMHAQKALPCTCTYKQKLG